MRDVGLMEGGREREERRRERNRHPALAPSQCDATGGRGARISLPRLCTSISMCVCVA